MQIAAIETNDLTLRFGALTAVDHLNLCVPAGSVYGFLGLNGAGKTSTIRMLLGLIRSNGGQVKLFGTPFDPVRTRHLLSRVGALVENPSLYLHLTGYENLELTRRLNGASRDQIRRVLSIVGLESAANRAAKGYSLGMKQRLGLALALLNDPKLLILDEPTNGLDPAGIREMRALIGRLAAENGITVFLSSHLLTEIEQVATQIGIIHKGHLLFQGAPDELHARLEEYISVEVDQPTEATKVLTNAAWTVQRDEHRLMIDSHKRSDAATINAQLVRAGINVYHISIQQPSLEDIFLKLTADAPADTQPTTQQERMIAQ